MIKRILDPEESGQSGEDVIERHVPEKHVTLICGICEEPFETRNKSGTYRRLKDGSLVTNYCDKHRFTHSRKWRGIVAKEKFRWAKEL